MLHPTQLHPTHLRVGCQVVHCPLHLGPQYRLRLLGRTCTACSAAGPPVHRKECRQRAGQAGQQRVCTAYRTAAQPLVTISLAVASIRCLGRRPSPMACRPVPVPVPRPIPTAFAAIET